MDISMVNWKPFKIVHLSDLHLTASDDMIRSEPKLFGQLKGMNAAFRGIIKTRPVQEADLIVVTGDVTDRGDIDSWKIFWKTISDAGLITKTLVLPGNHDMCCLGIRIPILSKTGYRKEDLEKAIKGLKIGHQPLKFPWAKLINSKIAVFGLNSNNLGNFSGIDNAVGELGFYELLSFAEQLWKYRETPVKIVALHHSPNIPVPNTMKKRFGTDYHTMNRLFGAVPQDQRRALRLLCFTHKVRLIIHGHVHLAENRYVNGIHIIGAPPATEPVKINGKNTGYQFYQYIVKGKKPILHHKLITIIV
jgi:Icc-related predicted phosphoesterase